MFTLVSYGVTHTVNPNDRYNYTKKYVTYVYYSIDEIVSKYRTMTSKIAPKEREQ